MGLDIKKDNMTDIVMAIKARKNIDFCVIYEYLAHEKLLQLCFSKSAKESRLSQASFCRKDGTGTNFLSESQR